MRSSLALIDQSIQAALAVESGEKLISDAVAKMGVKPARFTTIAGLRVPTNAAEDAKVDPEAKNRLERIQAYKQDRTKVEEQLKKAGVEPLAILPKRAWDGICDQARLYRFAPEGEMVRANLGTLIHKIEQDIERSSVRNAIIFRAISTLALTTLATAGWVHLSSWQHVASAILSCAALYSLSKLSDLFVDWDTAGVEKMRAEVSARAMGKVTFRIMQKRLQKMKRNKSLFSFLWPNMTEGQHSTSIALQLPDPPADVQNILKSMHHAKFTLRVAVVGDAIGISNQLTQVTLDAVLRRADERAEKLRLQQEQERALQEELRRQRLARQNDPIVYVEHGSAIAIVAQYGDFPIEKQVLDQVMNSINLV